MKKVIKYTPRALLILFIIFFIIFSFDEPIFSIGFLMHNIPTLFLLITVIIAWKKSLTGGLILLGLTIIGTFFFRTYQEIQIFSMLSLPPLIISALFLTDYWLEKKK